MLYNVPSGPGLRTHCYGVTNLPKDDARSSILFIKTEAPPTDDGLSGFFSGTKNILSVALAPFTFGTSLLFNSEVNRHVLKPIDRSTGFAFSKGGRVLGATAIGAGSGAAAGFAVGGPLGALAGAALGGTYGLAKGIYGQVEGAPAGRTDYQTVLPSLIVGSAGAGIVSLANTGSVFGLSPLAAASQPAATGIATAGTANPLDLAVIQPPAYTGILSQATAAANPFSTSSLLTTTGAIESQAASPFVLSQASAISSGGQSWLTAALSKAATGTLDVGAQVLKTAGLMVGMKLLAGSSQQPQGGSPGEVPVGIPVAVGQGGQIPYNPTAGGSSGTSDSPAEIPLPQGPSMIQVVTMLGVGIAALNLFRGMGTSRRRAHA